MIILELKQQVEVDTPKGRGRLFLVTEYGSEIEKILGCHSKEIGRILGYTAKSEVVHKDDLVGV